MLASANPAYAISASPLGASVRGSLPARSSHPLLLPGAAWPPINPG